MNSSVLIRLGNTDFRFRSSDVAALHRLADTFGMSEVRESVQPVDVDLDEKLNSMAQRPFELINSNFASAIDWLLANALQAQRDLLWLDAAALIAPNGRTFVLTGPSQSGKSTLALAMAEMRQWRIISEDITFYDEDAQKLVTFRAPISLREGGLQELAKLGARPRDLIGGQWYWNPSLFADESVPADPFAIITLEPFLNRPAEPVLVTNEISISDAIRALLPISNVLRLPNGSSRIARLLESASLFNLKGGTLANRIGWLSELAT